MNNYVEKSVVNVPAAAATASVATEAPAANEHIVVTGLTASYGAAATAGGPIVVTLFDGTTAGTPLWSCVLSPPVNDTALVEKSGCRIEIPTAGNVATLAFASSGIAATQQAVSLQYFREGVAG
jgi:hypothetical protein